MGRTICSTKTTAIPMPGLPSVAWDVFPERLSRRRIAIEQHQNTDEKTDSGADSNPQPVAQAHDGRNASAYDDETAVVKPGWIDARSLTQRQCHETQVRQ